MRHGSLKSKSSTLNQLTSPGGGDGVGKMHQKRPNNLPTLLQVVISTGFPSQRGKSVHPELLPFAGETDQ